jgi:FKBP-type peptidyl-prolyl cis-trans isomerase
MKNLFFLMILSLLAMFACKREDAEVSEAARREREEVIIQEYIAAKGFNMTRDKNGLNYESIVKNTPHLPVKQGDTVDVHYNGYLLNGMRFDSSYLRDTTFQFTPGYNKVIAGWELGILYMGKGDKMRFVIPSHLAYGNQGSLPQIPQNAPLYFEVEVVKIKRK